MEITGEPSQQRVSFSFLSPLQVVTIFITAANLCLLRDFELCHFEVNILQNGARQKDYWGVKSQNMRYHLENLQQKSFIARQKMTRLVSDL